MPAPPNCNERYKFNSGYFGYFITSSELNLFGEFRHGLELILFENKDRMMDVIARNVEGEPMLPETP